MSSQQTFTLNGAAKLTGYSLPTIRRRLDALQKAGATQQDGVWVIPLSALHTAGLMVKLDSNETPNDTGQSLVARTPNEIDALRAQLAEALQRAAVAEAVASEREKALERADLAMRMLEARGVSTERPGWLSRLRGEG
jgi:DeoR/GlpR family transcriptional regulator of sugar metabolism